MRKMFRSKDYPNLYVEKETVTSANYYSNERKGKTVIVVDTKEGHSWVVHEPTGNIAAVSKSSLLNNTWIKTDEIPLSKTHTVKDFCSVWTSSQPKW